MINIIEFVWIFFLYSIGQHITFVYDLDKEKKPTDVSSMINDLSMFNGYFVCCLLLTLV